MCGIPFMLYGMSDAMSEIADRVRGIAVEKRYTHERIAALLGLSRSSVSARMNGVIPWTGAELLILASALRIPVARFFPDASEMLAVGPVLTQAVAS